MIRRWPVFFAFKQLFPSKRRGTAFAYLSMLGVALGVCVLFVVLGIMNGFQGEICEKLAAIGGDIHIDSLSDDGEELDFWKRCLQSQEQVQRVGSFAYTPILLEHEGKLSMPILKVGEVQGEGLLRFAQKSTGQASQSVGIWLGSALAEELRVAEGGTVVALLPAAIARMANGDEMELPSELEVVGIFQTNWPDVDGRMAFLAREDGTATWDDCPSVQGFDVHLRAGVDAVRIRNRWNSSLLPTFLRARAWQEVNQQILSALGLEKAAMFFVLLSVLFIAMFSIASALVLNVVQKTREIGLLRVLGATRLEVALCYMVQGLFVGISGVLGGIALAGSVLYYRDGILRMILGVFGKRDQIFAFYQFTHLPLAIRWREALFIAIFSIILSMLAGVVPAMRAAKVDPTRAMNRE